jgi:hypothetical protein
MKLAELKAKVEALEDLIVEQKEDIMELEAENLILMQAMEQAQQLGTAPPITSIRAAETRERLQHLFVTVDGQRYRFAVPGAIIDGEKLTAEEMAQKPRILRHLLEIKSDILLLVIEDI